MLKRIIFIIYIKEPGLSEYHDCPYLKKHKFRQKYFFASDISKDEFNDLLIKGWRRFGLFFFKPDCSICFKCAPIRIGISSFKMSKSQKRVIKKNKDTKVIFKKIQFREELYEIYREHSLVKFGQQTDIEDFISTFFFDLSVSYQAEYYVGESLAAFGFIDITNEGISSIYFVYKTEYSFLSPGTFSVLKEIEYAGSLGLKYLYLGYYIENNPSMSYKYAFRPHELYDWKKETWNQL